MIGSSVEVTVGAGHVAELIPGEGSTKTEGQQAIAVGSSLVVRIKEWVGDVIIALGVEEWWWVVVSGFYCQE